MTSLNNVRHLISFYFTLQDHAAPGQIKGASKAMYVTLPCGEGSHCIQNRCYLKSEVHIHVYDEILSRYLHKCDIISTLFIYRSLLLTKVRLAVQVLQAMIYLHSSQPPMVDLDINPANILERNVHCDDIYRHCVYMQ